MAVPADYLRWGYRLFLDREPENNQYEMVAASLNSTEDVRRHFLSSPEFIQKNIGFTSSQLGIDDENMIIYFKSKYGFFMPISLAEPMTIISYMNDSYEEAESAFIHTSVSPGDYCIDLGARHGWFTGIMAARAGAAGRVYSFEPMPPHAGVGQLIEVNRFENVRMIAKGASDAPGIIEFDLHSLSANLTGDGPRGRIEVARIDDELRARENPIKLAKIDIEGAEYVAMQGAAELLSADHPLIVMELNDWHQRAVSNRTVVDLVALMHDFGYRCYTLDGRAMSNEEISARTASGDIFNVVFRT